MYVRACAVYTCGGENSRDIFFRQATAARSTAQRVLRALNGCSLSCMCGSKDGVSIFLWAVRLVLRHTGGPNFLRICSQSFVLVSGAGE